MPWTDLLTAAPWLLAAVATVVAAVSMLRRPGTSRDAEEAAWRAREAAVHHLSEAETRHREDLVKRHHEREAAVKAALDITDPSDRARALLDAWRREAGR